MDTMDALLQRKEEGRGFYHRMGARSSVAGFKTICGMLAEDESRQERVLLSLRQGKAPLPDGGQTLDGVRTILRRLTLHGACLPTGGEARRLGQAMAFEAGCVRICREMAAAAEQGADREVLLWIADEEEAHFTMLEEMRELVSGRIGQETEQA